MRMSRFVVLYRDVAPGEHVLYSVLSDRYIGVDDATLRAIERWAGQPPRREEKETAQVLLESGFLICSREDDDERLRAHLEKVSDGMPGTMYITLMPTLACNLACTYCFQKESPAFNRMDTAVESATVDWILSRVAASACRKLMVHFFGGEPLTRKDYVLRTAEKFSRAMAARGGEFDWEITTNGVYLDLPFVTAIRQYGNGWIKVTLDGDRETHDRGRVYRDGRGTFDIIFANLRAVAGHVRIRLGGNFLPGQEASYERLLARLEEANLLAQLDAIRFKPVVDAQSNSGGSCTGCGTRSQATETLVQINRALEARIPQTTGNHMRGLPSNPCELHWTNSFTIDPDGAVYKCPAVAGRPEMAIGNVQVRAADKPAPLTRYRPWEQCGECAFLPVCMGGCLGGRYLKTGRTDEVDCHKPEFDAMCREDVTARYRAELSDRAWETAGAGSAR